MNTFQHPSPPETPPAKKLTRLESIALSIFSAGIALSYIGVRIEESVWRDILLAVASLGFLSSIALAILSGVQRIQQKQATSLPRATLHVIKMVTLFMFLPAIIICAGVVIWAIMTGHLSVE